MPAETIRAVARDWAAADGASVTMSTGVNMGRHGTLAYWLVQMLSFVTGNLDRRGGNIESVGYYPTARRARAAADPARAFFDSRFGRIRHVRGSLPGNLLADEILTPGPGQVRALFVVAGNPLLSMADETRLRAGARVARAAGLHRLYRNGDGASSRTIVLPATDQFERADLTYAGLGLQHRPHVQYTDARGRAARRAPRGVVDLRPPVPGARLQGAARRGRRSRTSSRASSACSRRAACRSRGASRARAASCCRHSHRDGSSTEHVQTADARVDCCPALFARRASRGRDATSPSSQAEPPRQRCA